MNELYVKEIQKYFDSISLSWNAPDDFWDKNMPFSLDSFLLKRIIADAFIKGAELGYQIGKRNETVCI